MSTGLLDFLDIEKIEFNWMGFVIDFLKLNSIDFIIDSNQIIFEINILNFTIWSDDIFLISKITRNDNVSQQRKKYLDIMLFGMMTTGPLILKYKHVDEILSLIKNMIEIFRKGN